ncbi:MAG: CatA-like O-acetyltransferase [Dysosmobacter welbionis]
MGFQKIDYAAWPRRPYFEHYHRDVPCWYSMTVDVDISALLPRLRGRDSVLSVGDPRHLPDGQRGPGPPHGYGRDGGHRRLRPGGPHLYDFPQGR